MAAITRIDARTLSGCAVQRTGHNRWQACRLL